jgi:hypothetical protein
VIDRVGMAIRWAVPFAFAMAACGGVSSERPPGDADPPDAGDDAGSGAAVDAGPCTRCAPQAVCDPLAPTPCACRPGHEGDGTRCVAVVPELHRARVEVPCSPPSVPGMDGCTSLIPGPWSTTAGGDPGAAYRVTIRVRGALEHKSYIGGQATGEFVVGGTPDETMWNVYRLQVGDTSYHLNAGVSGERHCHAVDYRADIQVRTGDLVTLVELDTDGLMIANLDDRSPPVPIRIPDVAPYPDAFDGQFLQIDVEAVEDAP